MRLLLLLSMTFLLQCSLKYNWEKEGKQCRSNLIWCIFWGLFATHKAQAFNVSTCESFFCQPWITAVSRQQYSRWENEDRTHGYFAGGMMHIKRRERIWPSADTAAREWHQVTLKKSHWSRLHVCVSMCVENLLNSRQRPTRPLC